MKYLKLLAATLALLPVGLALAQDAEDAYRDARRALNRQEFDDAIAGFRALRRDYPDSSYAGDSYYWEAFALERNGNLEDAVELIDVLLNDHPDASTADDARALTIRVCSDLARRGDGECAALVSSTVRDTDRLDTATRLAAINALINMRAERAVPIASQVATNRDQPVELRRQALFILAQKAEQPVSRSTAVDVLRTIALDDTDNLELRSQAVFWLSEVPGAETLDVLSAFVGSESAPELEERAIFALSQHDDPRAVELLRRYAADDALSTRLRKQAIFWIADQGGEQSLPFLTDLYPNLTDQELKEQVLFAIGETGADEATAWLLARARDAAEPIEVRRKALFWAAEAGLSTDELSELYQNAREPALREHLVWLIAENGGEDSTEALLDIARNDPDAEMRTRAVFWLGESDDPRAADYLLQLLEP
jgi:hypothetical protein